MSNANMPFPFPDALQEFNAETSAKSSRFGTQAGYRQCVTSPGPINSMEIFSIISVTAT